MFHACYSVQCSSGIFIGLVRLGPYRCSLAPSPSSDNDNRRLQHCTLFILFQKNIQLFTLSVRSLRVAGIPLRFLKEDGISLSGSQS